MPRNKMKWQIAKVCILVTKRDINHEVIETDSSALQDILKKLKVMTIIQPLPVNSNFNKKSSRGTDKNGIWRNYSTKNRAHKR